MTSKNLVATLMTCAAMATAITAQAQTGALPSSPRAAPPEQTDELRLKSPALKWGTTQTASRMVFLNGTNINGVRNQDLENVNIHIDDAGNLHITASQYDVQQDSSYHPLMPSELPRFPKKQTGPVDMPEGRFSKQTGLPSNYFPGSRTAQEGPSESDLPAEEKTTASTARTIDPTPSTPSVLVAPNGATGEPSMLPVDSPSPSNGMAAKAKPAAQPVSPNHPKTEANPVPPPELPPEAQGPSL